MTHRVLGLVAGSLLLRVLVLGQTFGEITGVVTDASGGAVANATVMVTNPQTDFRRATTTNTAGNYTFQALLPGVYNVGSEEQGFQTEVRNGVQP
jgi:Carboxypeptidase regulatory-like domain